ncbi:MAG: hypothetical protein HAW63_05825 [Bdellovibrionaceae bacterium]|nr:hypothetical protein [Pseudobdellovibrionaceae bacterium]
MGISNKINHSLIPTDAIKIIKTLKAKNFSCFLVGGCIRDILLKKKPKDFDIVTSATPSEIRKAIPRAYIIGKRFRLVLAQRSNQQYEISTFRQQNQEQDTELLGEDNTFGTPEEDALRRDFTINALLYDPVQKELRDYTNGLEDLKIGQIKMIGDPFIRMFEDPVRILRAIRLTHKIHFNLDTPIKQAIIKHAALLKQSPLSRIREELLKFLKLPDPSIAFVTCHDLGVLKVISPSLNKDFKHFIYQSSKFLLFKTQDLYSEEIKPEELFAKLFFAYIYENPYYEQTIALLSKKSLVELNAQFGTMLSQEWGCFKYEQENILKALKLQVALNQAPNYTSHELHTVMHRKTLKLAIKMALQFDLLNSEAKSFWLIQNALQKT